MSTNNSTLPYLPSYLLTKMPLGVPPSHLPLLLHLLIETPASLSFLLNPGSQLPLLSSSSSSSFPSPASSTTSCYSSSSTPSSSKKITPTTKIPPKEATEARLILSNFGGLLLAVNLLVGYVLFGLRAVPEEMKQEVVKGVTAYLSVYHLFPMYRAWKRMKMMSDGSKHTATEKTLGGPPVHFLVHLVVGVLMGGVGLGFF